MVEIDIISVIVPAALAAVFSFIIMGVNKLGKASEGTLSGTIKLEHVSAGLEDLETRIERRFDKMELLITQRETESKQSLNEVWKRLDTLTRGHDLNTWRIDELEGTKRWDKPPT